MRRHRRGRLDVESEGSDVVMDEFIEALDTGYREMALDDVRELEAKEWVEAFERDTANE